jgi:menaquinone-dependent protoporphyrinogen oxidase
MKTIILFATKYGATGEIARRIAARIDNSELCDIKLGNIPALTEFDRIIVGSSIYAAQMRKEARAFLSQNAEILCSKQLGLFLCGISRNEDDKYFSANFPPNILHAAKAASFLGGIFDPKKVGAMERFVMKLVSKHSEYMDTIDDEKIIKFVEEVGG